MELICIKCPRGCNLKVEGEKVTGNLCPRGVEYAKEEMNCPMRILTALIKVNGKVVPVKTSGEIPKEKIKNVLESISKINVAKTKPGQIILSNVLGLGVNIVVTGEPYSSN